MFKFFKSKDKVFHYEDALLTLNQYRILQLILNIEKNLTPEFRYMINIHKVVFLAQIRQSLFSYSFYRSAQNPKSVYSKGLKDDLSQLKNYNLIKFDETCSPQIISLPNHVSIKKDILDEPLFNFLEEYKHQSFLKTTLNLTLGVYNEGNLKDFELNDQILFGEEDK